MSNPLDAEQEELVNLIWQGALDSSYARKIEKASINYAKRLVIAELEKIYSERYLIVSDITISVFVVRANDIKDRIAELDKA